MTTPHKGIEAIIKTGDGCLGKGSFGKDLSNPHLFNYNGTSEKEKDARLIEKPNR